MLPTDDFYDDMFGFQEDPDQESNFVDLGYETDYFIRNLGSLWLIASIYIILILMVFIGIKIVSRF